MKVKNSSYKKITGIRKTKITRKFKVKQLKKYIFKIQIQIQERQKRILILDGANLACGYTASSVFSVKGLKIAMEFFEKMGHKLVTIIPERRLEPGQTDDKDALEALKKNGKITFTPCKRLPGMDVCSYDDIFIIEAAIRLDGAVISNDNFRDLFEESSDYKKIITSRVVGFCWIDDELFIPSDPYGKYGPKLDEILYKS